MLTPLIALLMQTGPRDRPAFEAAMARVENGMTQAQVQAILGKPDDVWQPNNGQRSVPDGGVIWAYGTAGHLTLPVLGKILFYQGMASGIESHSSLPKNLPSESILVPLLRTMDQRANREHDVDPLRLIRSANALRGMEKGQVIATMIQYDRLGRRLENTFWLMELWGYLFQASKPPTGPQGESRNKVWPNQSFVLVDDIPFNLPRGPIGGFFPPFESYAKEIDAHWSIRTNEFRPPADPFPSYFQALALANQWNARQPLSAGNSYRQTIQASLFALIGDAPPDLLLIPQQIESAHQDFLKANKRWDPKKQTYQ